METERDFEPLFRTLWSLVYLRRYHKIPVLGPRVSTTRDLLVMYEVPLPGPKLRVYLIIVTLEQLEQLDVPRTHILSLIHHYYNPGFLETLRVLSFYILIRSIRHK